MGKKKTKGHRKASRSDKRMQKLYADAIKEVKKRNINLDDLPAKDSEDIEETSEEREKKEHVNKEKARKKPKKLLEETLKKQEQLRKPSRVSLSVPVSKLVPFKSDEKGLEFPRDFRRDSTSLTWIPRNSGTPLFASEPSNGRRSPSSDYGDEFEKIISCKDFPEERNDLNVEEVLQVLPLRIGGDADESSPEASTRSQLPPIYRQDLWQETMRRASTSSRSIPAKQDAWTIRDPAPLMVGRQELYSREKCKSSISLAERRFRLRASSSVAVLPSTT